MAHTRIPRPVFQRLVQAALADLPEEFRAALDNVSVVVEDLPNRATMREAEVSDPYDLVGFYHGVPLPERDDSYSMVVPDTISIYQLVIEDWCDTDQEIVDEVRITMLHELAHYFGIMDEEYLDGLGLG